MKPYRLTIISSAVTALVLIGAYLAAFNYQFGAPIPAGYELANWFFLKEDIAKQASGPRILLLGDSNVLFGMDSPYIEQKIGRPVVNLGLHGALPLDSILDVASRNARPGDTVILPIVWDYYIRDYKVPTKWLIDQVVAWHSSYFAGLGLKRKIEFYKSISLTDLMNNLSTKFNKEAVLKENPLRELSSPSEALANYKKNSNAQNDFSYSYLNMNDHGDMLHACGVRISASAANYLVPKSTSSINRTSFKFLVKRIKSLEARGIHVFVIAPVQVDDTTSQSDWYQAFVNNVWTELRNNGISVLGTPNEFNFKPENFFDTDYHLNCDANKDRSERIVKLLVPVLPTLV
ncbi:hypothetical protein [Legionella genomosp. 1]|uniref:hypothetical protein n=1 Tax=Legionella genomosp. 1 TaxID=1093625 RepID=UPI0010543704|nr:hypothetical protein [Legionella genomosp. 1]